MTARTILNATLVLVALVVAPPARATDIRTVLRAPAGLRAAPGFELPVLVMLRPGMRVEVIDSEREWLRVTTEGNAAGWIHGALLSRAAPPPSSDPEPATSTPPEAAAGSEAKDAAGEDPEPQEAPASPTPADEPPAPPADQAGSTDEGSEPEVPAVEAAPDSDPESPGVAEFVEQEVPEGALPRRRPTRVIGDPTTGSRARRLERSPTSPLRRGDAAPRPRSRWPVTSVEGVDDLPSCQSRVLALEGDLAFQTAETEAAIEQRDAASAAAFRSKAGAAAASSTAEMEARLERTTVALAAAQLEVRKVRDEADGVRAQLASSQSTVAIAQRAVSASEADLEQARGERDATLAELARTRTELATALDSVAALPSAVVRPAPVAEQRYQQPAAAAPALAASAAPAELDQLRAEHELEVAELKATHQLVYDRFIEFVTKRHEDELARARADIQAGFDQRLAMLEQAHLADVRKVARESGYERQLDQAVKERVAVEIEEARLKWEARHRGDANDVQLALTVQADRLTRECAERQVAEVSRAVALVTQDCDKRLLATREEADRRCQVALEIVLERAAAGEDVSRARELLPRPAESSDGRP